MADPPAPHAADSTRPSPAPSPGKVAPGGKLGRYQLLESLGAGAMGVVFKARDTERGDIVALKTLQKIRPGSLLRFKNEFRSVANITHRNLVTLYELACDGDTWFFTMEYIPGRNLASLIATEIGAGATRSTELPASRAPRGSLRAITTFGSADREHDDDDDVPVIPLPAAPPAVAGGPQMSLAFIRRVFRELAVAIDALHRAGRLHRDIKPANVMIGEQGRVVLLDFGLVADAVSTGPAETGMVGTPAYMAPEVIEGASASAASDWYAFGVMLYEALAGQLPFAGSGMKMLFNKALEAPFPLPASAGLPVDLVNLTTALIDRDPARRPKGAEVLDQVWAAEESPGAVSRATPALLVGREAQYAVLHEALDAVTRTGKLVVARLRGGSGMGKSALLEAFLADVHRRPDVLALSGRCYEQETLPYKALDAVVDSLARTLGTRGKNEPALLPAESMEDLARAFPVLAARRPERDGEARPPEADPDQQELRRRMFRALKTLLHRLSQEKVLVVSIDDVQWGDSDSGVVLRELLSPPDTPRMLLLYAFRSDESESSPVLAELKAATHAPGGAVETRDVSVDALKPEDAARLAAQLLGCKPDDPMAGGLARESSGNPFFLERLARHTLGRPLAPSVPAAEPAKVDDLVLRQLDELPERARRLLETVVVAGHPVPQAVAATAAGISGAEHQAWAQLRAMNLVRARGPRGADAVEVYHDRIREAIRRHLSPDVVVASNRRLGESFEAVPDVDPETPAGHFLAAGIMDKAGRYSVQAADRAAHKLAFARAADLYRQAMRCFPQDTSLITKCADALVNAGRCAESAPLYLSAAAADPERAFQLKTRAAEQLLASGRIEDGLGVLKPLLADVGIKYPKTPLRALFGIIARTITLRFRNISVPDQPGPAPTVAQQKRIDVTWAAGKGLGSVDILRGGYFIARSTDLAAQAREPRSIARGLAHVGLMTVSRARPQDVARGNVLIEKAAAIGEKLGDPYVAGFARINAGTAHMTIGEWAAAREELDRGLHLLETRCTGVSWECSFARSCMVNVLRCLGELDQLAQRGGEWLRTASENGDIYGAVWMRLHTAIVPLAADDPATTEQELRESVAGWSSTLFTPQHMVGILLATELDLYRGNAQVAAPRLEEVWSVATRSFAMGWQITRIWALALRGGAALAAARQQQGDGGAERDQSLARARRCAALLDKEGRRPHARGPALVLHAGLASWQGQADQAAGLLAEAAEQFREAGMAIHAASALWGRGQLVSDAAAAAAAGEAEATLRARGVKNIARWARMYLPGVLP
ncbi:MAG TPA: protein kinase [Polyangia bacterium]|jgi:serine/threonine protein kinase/tetratricopeptide (TPR) repeat protein